MFHKISQPLEHLYALLFIDLLLSDWLAMIESSSQCLFGLIKERLNDLLLYSRDEVLI